MIPKTVPATSKNKEIQPFVWPTRRFSFHFQDSFIAMKHLFYLHTILIFPFLSFAGLGELKQSVSNVVGLCKCPPYCSIDFVENSGFPRLVVTQEVFQSSVRCFSSNAVYLLEDAPYFLTNRENRTVLTVLNGHLETNAFLTVWSSLLSVSETNSTLCPAIVVHDAATPIHSPHAYFAERNYALPIVSNLSFRTRSLFPEHTNEYGFWSDVLSGSQNENWDELNSIHWFD